MGSKVTLRGQLMFPSDYLAAVEFRGRDVTLTVKSVAVENLQIRGGKKEAKPVITFAETKKKLVCNKTNADSIATMYGPEAEKWAGKRVTFYPTKTQCGRETVDCIRVRETAPTGAATPPPVEPVEPEPPNEPSPDGDSFVEEMTALMSGNGQP